MDKKISIILSTYNEAPFVVQTINEILNNIKNVEIILVDDSSSDGTLEKVKNFMMTFGQEVKESASFPDENIIKLRLKLIKEELEELEQALNDKNLLEVADALTDILYVTYGAGHSFGINLDACFEEVQRSNMSKLDEDGKPIYNEYGKVMKGSNFSKPNLKQFI